MRSLLKSSFIIILFTAVSFGQNFVNPQVIARAEHLSGDKFINSTKTPKGAQIFAVNQPRKELLDAIDKGLNDLFEVARKNRPPN